MHDVKEHVVLWEITLRGKQVVRKMRNVTLELSTMECADNTKKTGTHRMPAHTHTQNSLLSRI